MTEQLTLFNLAPVQTIKTVSDPYWDEIVKSDNKPTAPQHSATEYPVKGDWVLLDQAWMDSCLKAGGKEWRKNYEYKSTEDLKAEVFLVDPAWEGGIYVSRNGQAVYVPKAYYIPLSATNQETAPQHDDSDRWNPSDFGEVPRKADGDQLTIFYDDSDEPPDPDDYQNLDAYNQAWREWELRVGGQVSKATKSPTVELCVGGQVSQVTQKVAPQHDTHWVERYWVERGTNKYWYYRYCWMFGRKIHRQYIGSVHSPRAQQKQQAVEEAIRDGQSPTEIKQLLRDWQPRPSTMPAL
nr:hypothetical protein [Nostoc sp. SerVER01]